MTVPMPEQVVPQPMGPMPMDVGVRCCGETSPMDHQDAASMDD